MNPLRIRISLKSSPPIDDEKIDGISSKRRKTNNDSNIVSSASSNSSSTLTSLSEGDVEFPCVEELFIQPFSPHRSMSSADSSLEQSWVDTESNARLARLRRKFSGAEHEDLFLPPNFPDAETNAKSQYEDPILLFLENLRGATTNLDAAEVLLNADYTSLNRVRNSIRKGLGLFKKQYASQESFSEAFEEWKQEFADAVKAECGDKYDGCLNLGDALNPLAVALMIAHFAPGSCKSYDDTKNLEKRFRSKFCKIARDNECMRMFDWILAKLLHKEAGGVWSEDIRRAVSERFSIVDAKILVTEDTDNHKAEFRTFCADVGISKAEMNLIGLIIVGCHVKHHELGDPNSPLTVLVSSAPAYEELFSWCGYYETKSTRFLAYISHAQTWASKTLGNITLYPPERLKLFSARLACFYQAIAVDIAQSQQHGTALFKVKSVVQIAERYAGIKGMSAEELQDLHDNIRDARRRGGATVGGMRSEGLDLWDSIVNLGMVEEDDHLEALEMISSYLSQAHANLVRPYMMRRVAYDTWRELVSLGLVDKNDEAKSRELVGKLLSEDHAKLLSHFNLPHLRNVATFAETCANCSVRVATQVDMLQLESLAVNKSSFNEGQEEKEEDDHECSDDGDNIACCLVCDECAQAHLDELGWKFFMPISAFHEQSKRVASREYSAAWRAKLKEDHVKWEKHLAYHSEYNAARRAKRKKMKRAKQNGQNGDYV